MDGPGYIVVIANHYAGCVAGRREANVFSYTSSVLAATHPNVIFVSSLKDTTSSGCMSWANSYASSWQGSGVDVSEIQPRYTLDSDFILRDTFFTPPYPHPSYAIVGPSGTHAGGELLSKFVGPCCGYASYGACSTATAFALNETLHAELGKAFGALASLYPGGSAPCMLSAWGAWSACSGCGASAPSQAGSRTRKRTILRE